MNLRVEQIDQASDLLGLGAVIPLGLQRVGEMIHEASQGEWGVLGAKVAFRFERLSCLKNFQKYSSIAGQVAAVNSLWYLCRSASRMLKGEWDRHDLFTLVGSACTLFNIIAPNLVARSFLLRVAITEFGLVADMSGCVFGLVQQGPWHQNLIQGFLLLLTRPSSRQRGMAEGLHSVRRQRKLIDSEGLRANFDMGGGRPTHRVELEDGSYYMSGDRLKKINSDRKVQILPSGRPRLISAEVSDSDAFLFQGRLYEYKGDGKFADDLGNALRSVKSGKRYKIYPEVQPGHPAGLQRQETFELRYKGERRKFVKVIAANEEHFLSTEIWGHNFRRKVGFDGKIPERLASGRHDHILIRYDNDSGCFRLAEGVQFMPEAKSFFHNGKQFRVVQTAEQGTTGYYLGEMEGDPLTRLAVKRNGSGEVRVVDRAVRFRSCERSGDPWSDFTVKGKRYKAKYQDGSIVYGLREGGQAGLPEDWYVGRIVEGGFGPRRDVLVPLNRGELIAEFERKEAEWVKTLSTGKLEFEALPRPMNLRVVDKVPDAVLWKMPGNGEVMLERYELSVVGEHRIELLIPPQAERVYSLEDWLRMLRRFPENTLTGVQRLVVVPKAYGLGEIDRHGAVAGDFSAGKERCRIVDGSSSVFRTLVHEILGHGTERLNLGIERMTILGMKLDHQSIGSYGATGTLEHVSQKAVSRVARPDLREYHEYGYRLVDLLANLKPRVVEVEGATISFR